MSWHLVHTSSIYVQPQDRMSIDVKRDFNRAVRIYNFVEALLPFPTVLNYRGGFENYDTRSYLLFGKCLKCEMQCNVATMSRLLSS